MHDLVNFIKDVGFPIAVAGWVLIRLNGKMDRLTNAILHQTAAIQKHIVVSETVVQEFRAVRAQPTPATTVVVGRADPMR